MTRKSLFAATVIAVALAAVPIARGGEGALDMELSAASCAEGDCGYWNPFMDCMCIDLYVPNYTPRCGLADAP